MNTFRFYLPATVGFDIEAEDLQAALLDLADIVRDGHQDLNGQDPSVIIPPDKIWAAIRGGGVYDPETGREDPLSKFLDPKTLKIKRDALPTDPAQEN